MILKIILIVFITLSYLSIGTVIFNRKRVGEEHSADIIIFIFSPLIIALLMLKVFYNLIISYNKTINKK